MRDTARHESTYLTQRAWVKTLRPPSDSTEEPSMRGGMDGVADQITCAGPPGLSDDSPSLPGARNCREPRSLHELLWKELALCMSEGADGCYSPFAWEELLRRCATFPYEEEPVAPVGAGHLRITSAIVSHPERCQK